MGDVIKPKPILREETQGDEIHNAMLGANDDAFVAGELHRESVRVAPAHAEVVPGAVIEDRGAIGRIPQRTHDLPEDTATHHAEDVEMHDAEVRSRKPPIIVES